MFTFCHKGGAGGRQVLSGVLGSSAPFNQRCCTWICLIDSESEIFAEKYFTEKKKVKNH